MKKKEIQAEQAAITQERQEGTAEDQQIQLKAIPVKIGGRLIPLRFRMNQFIEAENEIGNLGDIEEAIQTGKNRGENLVKMIRIMGNAGLKAEGQEPDLTDEWLKEEMIPGHLKAYQMAVLITMSYETQLQAPKAEDGEEEERDLVLEEINKKKEGTNTHTDGLSAGA